MTRIEGKAFNDTGTDTEKFIGREFTESYFWRRDKSNIDKLKKVIGEAETSKSEASLTFGIDERKNIPVQLFLHLQQTPENNSKYIFFCAREITSKTREDTNELLAEDYESRQKPQIVIEKANRDRDFFVAYVSHELRSPLNTILGWTKILLTKDINESARKTALETIERSARVQAKLIDDLVDSERIASGKAQLELKTINLFNIIQNVCDTHKIPAETKNIKLNLSLGDKNIPISGDSNRLRQAFTILVSNILKFTTPGDTVAIDAELTENETTITVEGGGQRMKIDELAAIFETSRSNDEKQFFNSVALKMELSTAKMLIDKHNGSIRAENHPSGQSLVFKIILPLFDSGIKVAPVEKSTNLP